MEKDTKTIPHVGSPEATAPEHARLQAPPLRVMSLAKARKLIRKTSKQHDGLFRRLAKRIGSRNRNFLPARLSKPFTKTKLRHGAGFTVFAMTKHWNRRLRLPERLSLRL